MIAFDQTKPLLKDGKDIQYQGQTGIGPFNKNNDPSSANIGVYTFDNTYLKGEGIGTNMFPSCAFRGFGAPQTIFAIETHLDHLAHHLGVDPLEFKMQYLAKKGDETTTNGHIIEEVKLPEMLDVITRESDYWRKAKEYKPGCGRGIGIALYNHGGAFTGNGEQAIIKAHARLVKTGDRVSIQVGSTEMGQASKRACARSAPPRSA